MPNFWQIQTSVGKNKLVCPIQVCLVRTPPQPLSPAGQPAWHPGLPPSLPLFQESKRWTPSDESAARRILPVENPYGALHYTRAQSAKWPERHEPGGRWKGGTRVFRPAEQLELRGQGATTLPLSPALRWDCGGVWSSQSVFGVFKNALKSRFPSHSDCPCPKSNFSTKCLRRYFRIFAASVELLSKSWLVVNSRNVPTPQLNTAPRKGREGRPETGGGVPSKHCTLTNFVI